mmetsp:Transcript_4236/g.9137  ORF Transcript_4236/g.9137 Transcript_4236/m.9137 type:complete len:205 (-) Transcript_4236:856-1470(-)
MGIEHGGINCVKDFFRFLLFLAKRLEILKYLISQSTFPLIVHFGAKINGLLKQHGIFTQKLQFNFLIVNSFIVRIKGQMLDTQRTASHRIRLFIGILFSTHTQGQSINDPRGRGQLSRFHIFVFQILLVRFTNFGNIFAQESGFGIFGSIGFALKGGLSRQLHVFGLSINIFLPRGQPLSPRIVTDIPPSMSWNGTFGHSGAFR